MRPRPSGRGEPASGRGPRGRKATSMRPRPSGRGEQDAEVVDNAGGELQCGHGPRAVENADTSSARFNRRHFNAATALGPWRTMRLKVGSLYGINHFNAATA